MADYHRDVVKTDHDTKRRAERRAELAGQRLQEEAPLSRLQIDGRGCKIHRNTQEYENIEQMKVMVPWNGDQDCLIDRFDARSMLDFYRESKVKAKKSDEEAEIEERVAFEAFRDVVKLLRKGFKDAAGLAYVENEALDIRVKARSKASVDAGVKLASCNPAGIPTSHIPTVVAAAAAAAASEAATEKGIDDGDEDGDTAEDDMIDAAEDDSAALDRVGVECGIAHFTAQLQRAVVQEDEEEQESSNLRKKKPGLSRRKMAMRVKRMLGEGLNPFGKSRAWFKETLRPAPRSRQRSRASPDYGPQDGRSSKRHSRRQLQPAPGGHREYISEFTANAHSDSDASSERSHGGDDGRHNHLEARPGQVDPAAGEGPVALPAAANVVHGKRAFTYRDREEERAREAERGKITMNQMRVSKAAAAPGGKEKPADRLKRLMAAQFNGNVAADTKKQLERRQEQEREQKARAAVERHALAVPRGRAGNVSRRHDHGGDELERRQSPHSRSRSPPGRYRTPSDHYRGGSSSGHDSRYRDDRRHLSPRSHRR